MGKRLAVNIVIEREKVGKKETFIASSPDINVLTEGRTIDEVKRKFLEGLKHHLETFPEERGCIIIEEAEKYEMPMVSRIFL